MLRSGRWSRTGRRVLAEHGRGGLASFAAPSLAPSVGLASRTTPPPRRPSAGPAGAGSEIAADGYRYVRPASTRAGRSPSWPRCCPACARRSSSALGLPRTRPPAARLPSPRGFPRSSWHLRAVRSALRCGCCLLGTTGRPKGIVHSTAGSCCTREGDVAHSISANRNTFFCPLASWRCGTTSSPPARRGQARCYTAPEPPVVGTRCGRWPPSTT